MRLRALFQLIAIALLSACGPVTISFTTLDQQPAGALPDLVVSNA